MTSDIQVRSEIYSSSARVFTFFFFLPIVTQIWFYKPFYLLNFDRLIGTYMVISASFTGTSQRTGAYFYYWHLFYPRDMTQSGDCWSHWTSTTTSVDFREFT